MISMSQIIDANRRWNKLLMGPEHRISLKQAFYLISNSIAIRFKEEGQNVWFDPGPEFWELKHDAETDTADLKRFLVHVRGHIKEDTIDAYARTDLLSKFIASVQATWTGVQIITRLAQDLPVSLLEVSTASYIIVALLAYALWYQKPYNLGVAAEVHLDVEFDWLIPRCRYKTEEEAEAASSPPSISKTEETRDVERGAVSINNSDLEGEHDSVHAQSSGDEVLRSREILVSAQRDRESECTGANEEPMRRLESNLEAKKPVVEQHAIRPHDVWHSMHEVDAIRKYRHAHPDNTSGLISKLLLFFLEELLLTIPWLGLPAIHLSAWNYGFPTIYEAWIWRASSICLAAM